MPEKILVVEGERKLRECYRNGLKEAGYDVDIAADGCKALKKLRHQTVDLIVLDLVLPDGSGFDHLQRFLEVNDDLKVVINTSHSEYKDDFHSWFADAYLAKSASVSDLKRAIDQILHRN